MHDLIWGGEVERKPRLYFLNNVILQSLSRSDLLYDVSGDLICIDIAVEEAVLCFS